jgi:hypothetical protein
MALGWVLIGGSDSTANDKYEEYAHWWNQKVHSKTKSKVKRDENGKRLGQVFKVPTNPPSVSAAEAEAKGVVQDPTFVLGVAISNPKRERGTSSEEARAYPIHALGFELLNDTLGDVAIAASW